MKLEGRETGEKNMDSLKPPSGATTKDGKVYNRQGRLIEMYEGKWCIVVDGGLPFTL